MRLQSDDHVILRSQFRRHIRRRHLLHNLGSILEHDLDAVLLDRVEMCAACDERYVSATLFEHGADISADSSRAEYANFHVFLPTGDNAPVSYLNYYI